MKFASLKSSAGFQTVKLSQPSGWIESEGESGRQSYVALLQSPCRSSSPLMQPVTLDILLINLVSLEEVDTRRRQAHTNLDEGVVECKAQKSQLVCLGNSHQEG